jgi:hypothetical protein
VLLLLLLLLLLLGGGGIFGEFARVSAVGGVLRGLRGVLEARVLPEGFGGKGHEAAAHHICKGEEGLRV